MATTIGQALHDTRDTLASAYTSGGTSLVLGSGQGAKYAGATATAPYFVRVDDELFKVTARSTDTLTVVGAQGGTAAADHGSGAQVIPLLTHVDWNAARGAIVNLEDKLLTASSLVIPSVRALRAAASTQSISDSTNTPIEFTASDAYDSDTMHDPSSNNSRVVFTTAGVYLLTAAVEFTANATGVRGLHLRKNGSTYITLHLHNAVAGGTQHYMVTVTEDIFAANDYVEAMVYQSSTTSLTICSTQAASLTASLRTR